MLKIWGRATSSNVKKVLWCCEELGIPYDLVLYKRDPVTQRAPPEYRALHPFQTAPVITDGEVCLAESGAIIEYVIARYGQGRLGVAPDQPEFADYLFWLHFANASLMPAAMVDLIVPRAEGSENQGIAGVFRERADLAFELIDKRLATVPYFAGQAFTGADIIMLFPLTTMRLFAPRDLAAYPNIRAYLQRIGERPAYQRAVSKADPDLPPQLT